MIDLFSKVKIHYEQNLPFVLYCKPNSDKIIGLFQKNKQLYFLENFKEMGFVFAPFDGSSIPYIPQKHSDVIVEKVNALEFYFDSYIANPSDETAKFAFETLVQKGIKAVNNEVFEKVVLSRKEIIALADFDLETVFRKLLHNYSTAFNYCFYHPKIGMWMGATPEQFLKIKEKSIQTVALAGTKNTLENEEIIWGKKEVEEQKLVTDYIIASLNGNVDLISVSKPYTTTAGNLCHIKTDISATLKSNTSFKDIVTSLHPTAAVCGLPKLAAKVFISENEKYDREYYSGFLGELNIDLATFKMEQSDLFVNLRCMKIVQNTAEIFVGCGITAASIPADEFKETVNKSMTMKKVL